MMFLRVYILILVAILDTIPVLLSHFVWPLNTCLQADLCNHTWVPECGLENNSVVEYRLFIDECDMTEYNCDYKREFEITNYTECFPKCPIVEQKFYRMGNYKFVLNGRKMIYAPTRPTLRVNTPNLPARMLHGKRRYTPEARIKFHLHTRTSPMITMRVTTKRRFLPPTTRKLPILPLARPRLAQITPKLPIYPQILPVTANDLETYVIRKETVYQNGKKMIKLIKGFNTSKSTSKSVIML